MSTILENGKSCDFHFISSFKDKEFNQLFLVNFVQVIYPLDIEDRKEMIIAEISLIWRREAGGIFNMLGTTDFATGPDNHHLSLDVDRAKG